MFEEYSVKRVSVKKEMEDGRNYGKFIGWRLYLMLHFVSLGESTLSLCVSATEYAQTTTASSFFYQGHCHYGNCFHGNGSSS